VHVLDGKEMHRYLHNYIGVYSRNYSREQSLIRDQVIIPKLTFILNKVERKITNNKGCQGSRPSPSND